MNQVHGFKLPELSPQAQACIAVNLSEIVVGKLSSESGGLDKVSLPLTINATPAISIVQSGDCPAPASVAPIIH
jgi:hypothetical protein